MRLTREPMHEEYRGDTFVMDGYEHWQCDRCGENIMNVSEATSLGKALHDRWVEKHGYDPLTPREIRKLRRSLGMTQVEFEKALGLKSPTVSRWENAKVVPSQTADLLMRSLAREAESKKRPAFVVHEGGLQDGPSEPYRPTATDGDDYAMEG